MIQFNCYRVGEVRLEKLREDTIYLASMRVARRKSDKKIVVSGLDLIYKDFTCDEKLLIEPTFLGDSFNFLYFTNEEEAINFYKNQIEVTKNEIRDSSKYELLRPGLFRYAFGR